MLVLCSTLRSVLYNMVAMCGCCAVTTSSTQRHFVTSAPRVASDKSSVCPTAKGKMGLPSAWCGLLVKPLLLSCSMLGCLGHSGPTPSSMLCTCSIEHDPLQRQAACLLSCAGQRQCPPTLHATTSGAVCALPTSRSSSGGASSKLGRARHCSSGTAQTTMGLLFFYLIPSASLSGAM